LDRGIRTGLEMKMVHNGAHIIVVGNEKGGSGKSTTALHLAVYLLHQGHRVATVDVDSRQQTLTRYIRNRRTTVETTGHLVPMPRHVHLPSAWGDSIRENQRAERDIFARAIAGLREDVDYIVIDTPGFDGNLARLAHGSADTLVTPVNDSMIDLDVLARVDPVSGEPIETSPYSRNVQSARSERLASSGAAIDWVLVRVAARLGCRLADGIAERVIFRSLFPIGMTVFDPLEIDLLGIAPSMSHVNARLEYRSLANALRLPAPPLRSEPSFHQEASLLGLLLSHPATGAPADLLCAPILAVQAASTDCRKRTFAHRTPIV